MKKKILIVAMCLVLAFSLAFAVSAETCESCTFAVEVGTYYDTYTCTVCNITHVYIKEKYIDDINGLVQSYVSSGPISFEKSKVFELMSEELKDVYDNNKELQMQIDNLLYLAENSYNTAIGCPQCNLNHVITVYEIDGYYYTGYCTCGALSIEGFNGDIGYDLNNTWESFISTYVGTGDTEELKNEYMEYLQTNNSDLLDAIQNIGYFDNIVSTFASAYVSGIESSGDNSAELESKYNEGYEQGKIDGVQEFMSSSTYNDILLEEYNDGFEAGEISGVNDFKKSSEYSQALSEQYDKGVTEGVSAFKSSENYKNALNERYSTGYTEGIAYYKTSTEYTKALNTQYDLGKSVAVSEYVNTDEYKAILSSEYDRGYDDGVSDTEIAEEENGSNVGTIFAIVGAVLFIGLGVSLFIPKKKRGRK